MQPSTDFAHSELRRYVYAVLICVSAGLMLGRVFAVDAVDRTAVSENLLDEIPLKLEEKRQELASKGLPAEEIKKQLQAEEKTLAEDAAMRRPFLSANDRSRLCAARALVEPEMRVDGAPMAIDKVIQEHNWNTIDMVKHDGHLYSSKPPLYSVLIAGVYAVIYKATGWTLGTHPFVIGRILLVLFNVLPMIAGLLFLTQLIERFGKTDFGRIFSVAAAAFGTFLTTFSVVINNHVPAAVCLIVTLHAIVPILFDGDRRLRNFAVAGFFATMTVAMDLPALAFFAFVAVALLWRSAKPTLAAFAPAAALVAVAYFLPQYVVHGTLAIPYAHRGEKDNWYDYSYEVRGKKVESYWRNPSSVDQGEPLQSVYATNVLVGHHGIFSLTPIWALSVIGCFAWLLQKDDRRLQGAAFAILTVSIVCMAFYVMRPLRERNYSGMSSGFRWAFWLIPLWIVTLAPAVDYLAAKRWGRGAALALLVVSVLSAAYPTWNPWSHPWLTDLFNYLHWGRPI